MEKFDLREAQDQLSCTDNTSDSREEGDVGKSCDENVHQHGNIGRNRYASESFELLKTRGMRRLDSERVLQPTIDPPTVIAPDYGYSTEKIMRIASKRFTESYTRTINVVSMLDNPFGVSSSGLPDEDTKKVELAELLIISAEKVSEQLYDRAQKLLDRCDALSSSTGNAVERVVYYFSKALRERIDQESGKTTTCQGQRKQQLLEIDETPKLMKHVAIYQEVPFTQIAHCAATQTVLENVTEAKKIHAIDLEIRSGVQWTGLMQSLVSDFGHSLEMLKITAVGRTSTKEPIEETGKRLMNFAESISLPFSFNIVMVSDMLELHEDQFKLQADETVVVYASYLLKRLIPVPDKLDYMMRVIRVMKPSVMVVIESELNSVSPSFVQRFVEAIFYFSAYFDCLECCMGDDPSREDTEQMFYNEGIRIALATEGEERNVQHAKLDVWRVFFARFGMAETELSTSSMLHGKMMAAKFASGNACTLEPDGKSLLIGWKGTPLFSLSAWKFSI